MYAAPVQTLQQGLKLGSRQPHDTVGERARADRVPYREWVRDGWLKETPGNTKDGTGCNDQSQRFHRRGGVSSLSGQ